MRWKPEPAGPDRSAEAHEPAARRERIRNELEARGVEASTAEALAEPLQKQLDEGRMDMAGLLDGVALGLRAQGEITQQLSKNASEVQEIERLMGSFASELSKLDEVLEVLAAYLRRMRTTTPTPSTRILH